MLRVVKFVLLVSILVAIQCSPFDDGKYSPRKYRVYDDGKYYRPLTEGKYLRGPEGLYTYIYQQGLYPNDDGEYRYIHQIGPDGGIGGEGDFGPDGPAGSSGPDGPGGPGGFYLPPKENQYIGKQIYAKRYPYIHKVIKSLVDKYVSEDNFGEDVDSSVNHYRKVNADKEIPVKCRYMMPNNTTEFTTQYPPSMNGDGDDDGEKYGSYYSFRGSKLLSDSITGKLKLEYEVFVRVVEVNN